VHSDLASKLESALQELTSVERQNIVANEKNKELAQSLLALAEHAKKQSTEDIQDPQLRDRVHDAEASLKVFRRRAKILKGVISGIIVASGVDWAGDEKWRELVMDDEDDG
jgi:hypothetical protein